MNLQPAIQEIKTYKQALEKKIHDIDEALSVLERLNIEMPSQLTIPKETPFEAEVAVTPRVNVEKDKQAQKPFPMPPAASSRVSCAMCHCTFSSQSSLESHNSICHPAEGEPNHNPVGKHKCSYCAKKFNTSVGLNEHIELRHEKEK